jgi:hypothetical protein
MTKIAASGSISQRHGSADPDPNQNVMDPEHWPYVTFLTENYTNTKQQEDALKTQRWANNDMTCLCNQMHKKLIVTVSSLSD